MNKELPKIGDTVAISGSDFQATFINGAFRVCQLMAVGKQICICLESISKSGGRIFMTLTESEFLALNREFT